MVGLNELGEVAWALERAMNSWLQREQPVNQALINMIAMAIPQFTDWINALRLQGYAQIEADLLIQVAQQIEENKSHSGVREHIAEHVVQPIVVEAKHEPELAPPAPIMLEALPALSIVPVLSIVPSLIVTTEQNEEEESLEEQSSNQIQIGSVSLHASLFSIGSEESSQHVAVLHAQLAALMASPVPVIEYDFMRAAHTLAGVNRAMGFTAIVDLAYALEAWLQARIEHPFKLQSSQLELLQNTVNTLDRMVQDLCARQYPRASSDMLYLLNMDRDKLHVEEQVKATVVPISIVPISIPVEKPIAVVEMPISVESAVVPTAPVKAAQPTAMEEADAPILVRDDVDEQLLPVFLEEADDLVPKLEENLRVWRDQPGDEKPVRLINRLLHTLKGSARMAGAMRIGQIAHEMEDAVLTSAKKTHEAAYWDGLTHEFDRIVALVEELRTGKPAAQTGDHPVDRRRHNVDADTPKQAPDRRMLEIGAERALQTNMLRVRADVIDQLVNEASEISVARARMESELRAFKDGLLELTESITRLRKQLREVEIQAESQMQARVSLVHDSDEQFDPLEFDRFTRLQELTRFMNESVHDVQTVQQTLLKNLDETTAAMSAQGRLNRELQQSLMNVRMVPFNSITDRLYRIVRQTGKELNKRANLELSGTSVELDRSVLEKMTAPFEHLLRNAMAHGLESEQQRNQAGKQPIGEIRLSLQQENNEVMFEFSDNGAGLNFPALREKAIAQGFINPDEAVTEDQLAQLIFTSGISTAGEVTAVAGRGIGMDVVRSEISALGGRIDVSSRTGVGTKFTIHLPLTLAVTQVLTVRCEDNIYAIPAVMVEQVRQLKLAEIEELYRVHQLEWNNKPYPFHYLSQLLGETDKQPEFQARNTVLLLRSGEVAMALHVEELIDNHEAVVKNIGPQLARLQGIAGATVQANGRVVLILNPLQVLQNRYSHNVPKKAAEILRKQPLIMVVDDSLTVRKITTRMLTRMGYDVITAKDGVDALEQLADTMPSLMLLDVEMPRMDGFELTKRLRQDNKTKNLPIIMITSRTADKHRDHALQLGVNAYMGKPYQEDFLLERIASFVNASHTA
jgi:chemosensory pili system protein ChpA (sensor histidine kinase/response regulator)